MRPQNNKTNNPLFGNTAECLQICINRLDPEPMLKPQTSRPQPLNPKRCQPEHSIRPMPHANLKQIGISTSMWIKGCPTTALASESDHPKKNSKRHRINVKCIVEPNMSTQETINFQHSMNLGPCPSWLWLWGTRWPIRRRKKSRRQRHRANAQPNRQRRPRRQPYCRGWRRGPAQHDEKCTHV